MPLTVLCLATITFAAPDAHSSGSQVIAFVETDHAAVDGVIKATVPLPVDYLSVSEQNERIGIVDATGALVAAQTDPVAYHPNGTVSIVEISAPVTGVSSLGQPAGRYIVRTLNNPVAKRPPQGGITRQLGVMTNIKPALQNFLANASALTFRTTDVFGKQYTCKPFAVPQANTKIYREGNTRNTVSMSCPLTPVNGFNIANQQELPRLGNITVIATTETKSPVVKLDVLFGNTLVKGAPNTPFQYQGNNYFKSLQVILPHSANYSYSLVNGLPDPTFNPNPTIAGNQKIYDLIKPNADGTMHIAPAMGTVVRRLAITPTGQEALGLAALNLQGQAFVQKAAPGGVETFSYENNATANYDIHDPLPSLSFMGKPNIRAKFNALEATYRVNTANGTSTGSTTLPFYTAAMGYHHFWGPAYPGMTGGTDITANANVSVVWGASTKGLLYFSHKFKAYLDRNARFHFLGNGEPYNVDMDTVACNSPSNPTGLAQKAQFDIVLGLPVQLNQDDPFKINQATQFNYHRNKVAQLGMLPVYEPQLLSWKPIDFQHLTRFTMPMFVLIELQNDPVAKITLEALAENIKASIAIYAKSNNASCPALPSSLLGKYNYTLNNPGKGAPVGRDSADQINAVVHAYKYGSVSRRNSLRPWLTYFADTLVRGQIQCSGYFMAKGFPAGKLPVGAAYQGMWASQSIEEFRIGPALRAIKNIMMKGTDSTREQVIHSAELKHLSRLVTAPYTTGNTIAKFVVTYNQNTGQVYCPSTTTADMISGNGSYESYNSLMLGYLYTGNQTYRSLVDANTNGNGVLTGLYDKMWHQGEYSEGYAVTGLRVEQGY